MPLSLSHQNAAEFAARFWKRVIAAKQASNQVEYCRLLHWLTEKLIAGDITDAQARTSFNTAFGRALTAGQWTTMRTSKITPAHDRYAAMLADGDL